MNLKHKPLTQKHKIERAYKIMSKDSENKNPAMEPTVKIVDGTLILSLPNATSPVVWQMDLEQAKSAGFSVDEDKKEKSFNLVLKSQDGTSQVIAPFDTKDAAVEILMQTSAVLQGAHGQIKTASKEPLSPKDENAKNNKRGAILAVLLILVLLGIWSFSASNSVQLQQDRVVVPDNGASVQGNSAAAGVPMSADDFLNNR